MVTCKQQTLMKEEPITAIPSAPPGKCLARRKGYMITCLNIQFKASGHCITQYLNQAHHWAVMNSNRSRLEFLPERWQNNPHKKQHQYSSARACFSEPFLKSYGPSIIYSRQLHSRDLRTDDKRPVTSLFEKNRVIFPKGRSTDAIQIAWTFYYY